jgi:hypothetical protein
LNEQCLELLSEQAVLRSANAPPMFKELVDLWSQLDVVSRRRAAACPFLPKTFLITGLACPIGSLRMARSSSAIAPNRVQERMPADVRS